MCQVNHNLENNRLYNGKGPRDLIGTTLINKIASRHDFQEELEDIYHDSKERDIDLLVVYFEGYINSERSLMFYDYDESSIENGIISLPIFCDFIKKIYTILKIMLRTCLPRKTTTKSI